MTDFTATTSPALFETNGSTNTWRVSNVGVEGPAGETFPTQTGNGGAVLGTNGTATSWARSFTSPDGETVISTYDGGGGLDWDGAGGAYAYADVDSVEGAVITAGDGVSESAMVKAKSDGTIDMVSTGAVTVTPGDGFHVVGDIGETVLNGDDYLMETASDTDVQAPGATFARARGSVGSESAVTNGDILAYPLYAQGHDGTSLVLAGQITAEVDGTVATGKVPTRIRIATADADGVLTDRLVLNPDGTSELNGTLLDLDTSGASTGDVATWDGTKIVLDTPTGGGGGGGGGGAVVQVKSTFKNDTYSHSNTTTRTAITGLSVAITPTSASNKMLVTVALQVSNSGGNLNYYNLLRDGSAIAQPSTGSGYYGSFIASIWGNTEMKSVIFQFLDSPATTSEVTYSVDVATNDGTTYVNRRGDSGDFTGTSSITVMEVTP